MANILIIEDDTDINNMMAEALEKSGYGCIQAFSGTEGLLYAQKHPLDLVILDLMLPGMDGETLLPQIKAVQNIPIIVLSAKDSLDSKVGLLTAGAEDYMTKPFEIQELLARIAVQIRRFSHTPDNKKTVLTYKDLQLDLEAFTASIQGHLLELTRQEFKILELLLSHPDRVYSKQDIYDYAWDDFYMGEDKTIHVHISNIRKKLRGARSALFLSKPDHPQRPSRNRFRYQPLYAGRKY